MTLTPSPTAAERCLRSLEDGHSYVGKPDDILVGREHEQAVLSGDLERVESGHGGIRLLVGTFGSGKSLLMRWVAEAARRRGMVVMRASLGPQHRLSSTAGDTRRLLCALTQNTSTRARPSGHAFEAVLERFLTVVSKAEANARLDVAVRRRLEPLLGFDRGPDVVDAVDRYVMGHLAGDEHQRRSALRWLRGEYESKVHARRELGVQGIIEDADVFKYLRVLSAFVETAEYAGLVIMLDELTNLFRALAHPTAREKNLEQLLELYNDAVEGEFGRTLLLVSTTPEIVNDERRGLASYPALRRRIIGPDGVVSGDTGSVLALGPFPREALPRLVKRIGVLWSAANRNPPRLTAEQLTAAILAREDISWTRTDRVVKAVLDGFHGSDDGSPARPSASGLSDFQL